MTKNLTEGSPAKLILFFTLPLLAGNIFQQLYSFVDTLIVGRFLGVEALAAVGCTGSLMFLMLGFVMGFATGVTIYTGQRYGAKDMQGVRQSVAVCTILSVILSIVLTIIGVLSCRELLILMQTPAEILDDAFSFISIVYGGLVLFVFLQLQTNLLRALGDSKMPTVILASTLFINILLEPVAIIVLGLGIPGAALATLASQLIGNIICFTYIRKKVVILHTQREDWHISWQMTKEHLSLGLPMGFQSSIIAIGQVMIQIALNQFGPVAVASYAAAQKVESIAMMPMVSFGLAMAAYTAQNYGAGQFDRISEGVRKCAYMSVAFSITAGALLIYFAQDIMYLFVGPGQQDVLNYGQEYLLVNGSCYWILSFLFIFRYTLQGLGQSIVPTIAGIMELVMRGVASIFLCSWLGYLGACLANPMAWIGSCVPLAIAFWWTHRKFPKNGEALQG